MVPTADKTAITVISHFISAITMTRTIFIFHLKTCWCSHRVVVAIILTQNFLSWNQDGQWRVWDGVIYIFETSTKLCKSLPYTKVLYKENFGKASLSLYVFLLLSNRQGYFFTFSASDSSWLESGGFFGGFLILFSWLYFLSSFWFPFC